MTCRTFGKLSEPLDRGSSLVGLDVCCEGGAGGGTSYGRPVRGRLGCAGAGGVVVAVAALLAGCRSPTVASVSAGSGSDRGTIQARQVLARYESSYLRAAPGSVGISSEAVGQVGIWERAVGANNKIAVLTGHVRQLPTTAAGAGHSSVRWTDGRTVRVPTISAHQAFRTLQHDAEQQSCGGCTPVALGDARLTRAAVRTTTGNATVPVWSFAVRGSRVRVTVIAIDTAAIVPALPQVSAPPGPSVPVQSAHATEPRTLTLTFMGAVGTGRVACGADYTATAVESRHAVAVIIRQRPHRGSVGGFCAAIGQLRTATAQLTAPLAGRAVLDAVHGQAVPLQ